MTNRLSTIFLTAAGALLLLVPGPAAAQAQEGNAQAVAEGARLYNSTCTRCHNARPATERSDAEWRMIVAHMRAIGNLPASRARAILAFMQATNGRDGPRASTAEPAPTHAVGWQILPLDVASYLARLRDQSVEPREDGDDGEE